MSCFKESGGQVVGLQSIEEDRRRDQLKVLVSTCQVSRAAPLSPGMETPMTKRLNLRFQRTLPMAPFMSSVG